ncbi:sodium:solute symporter family protein [Labilibaculum sp. K2S]|uniref:sodium:solute symporter family protein n=1 Tax=Labilibaculum sp. K2S TaxID=3056386 RepID=UPI0025A3B17F|nr:sodium:solute symporter family protein [Labilibaculum sp. K2S]MDM8158682.1 sodium:solute symporter family protein [Labilibaculum sp. K2S]
MKLEFIDIAIVIGYIILSIVIGFWLSKRANKNLQNYFLGGNQLKWYYLGLSNGSGMFDISGTAWTVTIFFVYGLKSVWIPWLWPVWNQIFIMIFMAVWLRRSKVMTGAEWITTRFGSDKGGRLSHIIVVVFAIISAIGFIAYFFVGIGKFAVTIFPWDLSLTIGSVLIISEYVYATILLLLTTLYVIKGGMYSVVATEVMQFFVMTLACVAIAWFAMNNVSVEQINAAVPNGWFDITPSWSTSLDWTGVFDQVNDKISEDGFGMLGALVMMMFFKGIFSSLAGPVPGYDMQRILSTQTPRDAAKMSGLTSLVLYPPRYLMVASLGILGLVFVAPMMKAGGGDLDFEKILPYVINNLLPVGLKGIILAGLLAAFMSTFSAFVNAAPAYIVNDLYKQYINPHASDKKYIRISYIASFGIVIVGIVFGLFSGSINSLTLWITSSLYGGYVVSNVLKWVWWRFNGYGYFWGMIAGLAGSTVKFLFFPDTPDIYIFPIILIMASAGSFLGCYLSAPVDDRTLIEFYKNVRPWGWWNPVYEKARKIYPEITKNEDLARDGINVLVGIVWQMTLITAPVYLVVRHYQGLIISLILFAITSTILKFNWLNKIKDYEKI